jgi:hypothetical protein
MMIVRMLDEIANGTRGVRGEGWRNRRMLLRGRLPPDGIRGQAHAGSSKLLGGPCDWQRVIEAAGLTIGPSVGRLLADVALGRVPGWT